MPQNGDVFLSVEGAAAVGGIVGAASVDEAHASADSAVADVLADLDALPVADHVARFEAVHDALRSRLAGEPVDGGIA